MHSRGGRRRPGNVVVWLLVSLAVILGVIALGMDGGRLMEERRHAQAAADAAALAAADDLFLNYGQNQGTDPSGTAQAAALASAQANGYANDGAASTIAVNIPPRSGPFAGQADYVEVVIQSNLPGSFSALFTQGPLPVRARATARGRVMNIGLLLLQPSGAGVLSLSGNSSVKVPNAAVLINSTSAGAVNLSGNSSVSAKSVNLAGGATPTGTILAPVNTSVAPTADPLRTLPPPNPADYPVQATTSTSVNSGAAVLQPGVYRGGVSVNGGATLTLQPGVYIMDGGGFQVTGQGTVTGAHVMIYNTGGSGAGPISISGGGAILLTAPSTGVYQGISIFQDRSVNQPVQISGNGSVQITGLVYAPGAMVDLSGNSGLAGNTLGGGYVANNLQTSGNSSVVINQGGSRPRAPDVRLVE